MIRSMTGYGRAQLLTGGREISVEIKSVNHRYFEFSARVPRAYGYLEEKLKSFVHGGVQRGKTDAFVSIAAADDLNAAVEINRPLARSYLEALRGMGSTLDLKDDITVSALSRFPDLFVLRREQEDEAAVWQAVREAAAGALANMLAMREAEGGRLRADIMSRLALLEGFTARVEERSPGVTAEYRARLLAKLNEVLEGRQLDEGRILTEAAVFAEKTAVDEETVRLRSHIAQLREFLGQGGPVGRKLDFLVQELNREANTIGSKAQDLEIARVVVEMKSEIEKIREQVQNIE